MARYTNIPTLTRKADGQNRINYRYRGSTKYPEIPLNFNDIYVYTTIGDRLDILAQEFYSDSTLWWIIASANPTIIFSSYNIPEGSQIRIPSDIAQVQSLFNQLNNEF